MRLVALMAWYDEDPRFLRDAVLSAAGAGCTALVAADGAYELFPGGRGASPRDQRSAIERAAREAGIDLLMHVPARPWATEMDKRRLLFRLGESLAAGWYVIHDADFRYRVGEGGLDALLTATSLDVAEVKLLTPPGKARARYGPPPVSTTRALFRAIPGLTVGENHYTYVAPSGDRLWGNPADGPVAEALDLIGSVAIEHLTYRRPVARIERQFTYYDARDAAGIEAGDCRRCGQRPATRTYPTNYTDLGDEVACDWLAVCDVCAPRVIEEGREAAARYGFDPERALDGVPLGAAR